MDSILYKNKKELPLAYLPGNRGNSLSPVVSHSRQVARIFVKFCPVEFVSFLRTLSYLPLGYHGCP